MFSWIQRSIRSAVVRGVHEGLADVGLIDPDAAPDGEAIRAAIGDKSTTIEGSASEPAARRQKGGK